MSLNERIKHLLEELKLSPKKSLGQNFLVSESVVNKIINSVQKFNPQNIIEIGPGLGSLTVELKKLNASLILIELDHQFCEYWRSQNFEVEEIDALKWNWKNLKDSELTVLVSNLPYQISSSLVIDRSIDEHFLRAMILMFQKEVAQRIKAKKGQDSYGMLSVIAQTFWKIDLLLEASNRDFFPPPQIASRVLVFEKIKCEIINKKDYLKLVKACFLHPRKLMISNLNEGLGLDKESLKEVFNKLNINLKVRAEELEIVQFVELFKILGYK